MGDSQSVRDVSALVKEKGGEHGNSWLILSEVFEVVYRSEVLNKVFEAGYFTLWFMVLFKLCRVLYRPHNKENWIDIQGYAELALKDIEKNEA